MYINKTMPSLLIVLLALFIGVVSINFNATAASKKNIEVSDPLEPVNRAIYGFNKFVHKIFINPVTKTYRFIVPDLARKGVSNVVRNLSEPVTLLNSVLQGDAEHSFTTFWRFTINSTIGLGGIFDVAKEAGLEHRYEDFGQTMGHYGVGNGPYIVLPILGPSNGRDTVGFAADIFSDPFTYTLSDDALWVATAVKGLDTSDRYMNTLEELDRVSLDPYAALRSLYTQKRLDEINNGK